MGEPRTLEERQAEGTRTLILLAVVVLVPSALAYVAYLVATWADLF